MTTDAWITLAVLVATFAVLAFDRLPAAAAMGAAVGVLLLANVVDQGQALSGLASSAPVTIAALYVLAGAATVTGALSPLIDRVLAGRDGGAADDPATASTKRLGRLALASGVLSSVLPNTPYVALAAPRVVTWCRRAGVSASPYLMPMSYAAVFGGVVTVIGTSTNLVVSDLLVAQGGEPLGVFEITGVGLPVAVVGIGVLVLTAPRLLRRSSAAGAGSTADVAQPYTIALAVEPNGPLVGRTVEAAGLRHLHGVFLAGIERAGTVVPARPNTVLGGDDVCYFAGDVVDVVDLLEVAGLRSAEDAHLVGARDRLDAGLFEAVVSERSDLAGSTLRDAGFRARYDAAVLAIRRHDDDLPGKLGSVVLRPGDVLLVLATPEFERVWRGHGDFSVIASLDAPPPVRSARAGVVVAAIVAMVVAVVANLLDLMEASLLAAVVLVATRTISVTEARRAVNLNVVLTIAMSISLGTAVSVSGLAGEMATLLGNAGDPFGDTGRLIAVLAATMILTELLSNNAAAALMLPVATAAAIEGGIDPRAFAIVVLIGASCSFLSPIGYQTNLMVYGLGGYRFADFTRVGVPLSLVTLIVTPIVVPLVVGL
ncbi:MAG TPA: SLC13 family permease [Ilumatobacteraceae bacterium]|nr:SLC13 family permease [Ilumatobacteraceae bacterium]